MKQWHKALVNRDANLEQAIKVLDKAALRIALVVDPKGILLGTLTDGDVRRALLKHFSMETPVEQVMNTSPKTGKENWTENRILDVMRRYKVLQLPLVDNEEKIVGLASLDDVLNKSRHDNPVFLMAGGFGTRLRPLTNTCPKPMLKVGDKPILEQILLNFIKAGFHNFYISVHYMPEIIKRHFGDGEDWGVRIRYVHEAEPLGTAGALGMLPHEEFELPVFVMNGDLLTSLNIHGLLEFHESHEGVATMCVREYEQQIPYGVVTSQGSQILSMVEKPVHRFFINAGVYLLDPKILREIRKGERIDMPALLDEQIEKGKVVNMFPVHEHWLDIGRIDDFYQAQTEIMEYMHG